LKIVVCVKQVPDTAAKITVVNGQVSWGDSPLVINPWDEFAVEAALQQGSDVTAITLGEAGGNEALKQALAMGCSEAVLIADPALADADSQAAARVLAAAIRKLGGVQLVVFGRQAVDGDSGITAAQTARALGWNLVSLAAALRVEGAALTAERAIEEGRQVVTTSLPAVVSVTKDIGEPRYPSFMGIRKASRAVIPTWSLADLDMTPPAAALQWRELSTPPSREVTVEIIAGSDPREIAASLADKILAEKVL
jgi:electron transfer flavoprotein beta subunit